MYQTTRIVTNYYGSYYYLYYYQCYEYCYYGGQIDKNADDVAVVVYV